MTTPQPGELNETGLDPLPYGSIPQVPHFSFPAFILSVISFIVLLVSLPPAVVSLIIDYHEQFEYLLNFRAMVGPVVIIGVGFYYLRGRWPLVYGAIEVLAATATIWVALSTIQPGLLTKVTTVLGGLYIIVRGMDNIEKGLPSELHKGWLRRFPHFKRR